MNTASWKPLPSQEQEVTSRSTSGEHHGQLQLSPAYNSHRSACKSSQNQECLKGDSDSYHLSDRKDDHLQGPVPLIDLTWVNSQVASMETSVLESTPCHSHQTLTTTEVTRTSHSKTTAASPLHQPSLRHSQMTTIYPLCQLTPSHHNSLLQQPAPLHRLVIAVIPLQQPAPRHPQITAVRPAIHQQPRQHHQQVSMANPQSPMYNISAYLHRT